MNPYSIHICRLPSYAGNGLPSYRHPGDAGVDLFASSAQSEYVLQFGRVTVIPTGMKIGMPVGMEAQVRPRGGHAAKHGVIVVNSPGTVDAGYRGEIMVILSTVKNDAQGVIFHPGDRIAQLVFAQVITPNMEEVAEFCFDEAAGKTQRGEGRFTSTGER